MPVATELHGKLQSVISHDADGRMIGRLGGALVVGYLPGPQIGAEYTLTGQTKDHPRFGEYFKFDDFEVAKPQEMTETEQKLMEINGIGKELAKRLVNFYGSDAYQKLQSDPSLVAEEVPGIGPQIIDNLRSEPEDLSKLYPLDYISYSQLDCYQRCPYEFQLNYIQDIDVKPQSHYLEYGTLVHEIREEWGEGLIEAREIPQDILRHRLDQHVRHNQMYWPDDETKEKYLQAEQQAIADLSISENRHVIAVEQTFNTKLASNLSPIYGYIDRIDRTEDGELVIVDYKTGKSYDQEKADSSLQMHFYAAGCLDEFGQLPKFLEYRFTRFDETVRTRRSQADIDYLELALAKFVKDVATKKFDPDPDWFWCNKMCSFGDICCWQAA